MTCYTSARKCRYPDCVCPPDPEIRSLTAEACFWKATGEVLTGGVPSMTRYAEMYRTEQEAHDLTTNLLAFHRDRAELLLKFIQETGQQDAFCNWLLERNRVRDAVGSPT